MPLSFNDTSCVMSSPTSAGIATLNTDSFSHLAPLHSSSAIEVEGLLSLDTLNNLAGYSGNIMSKTVISIDLVIYGTSEVSETVAGGLCRCGLFLQDPHRISEGISFDNPQSLKLPAHIVARETVHMDAVPINEDHQHFQVEPELDFNGLIDQFSTQNHLSQANVDGRIATRLLESVKHAISETIATNLALAIKERDSTSSLKGKYLHHLIHTVYGKHKLAKFQIEGESSIKHSL